MQNPDNPEFGVRSPLVRYFLAVLIAILAVLLGELLSPWLGQSGHYLPLWTAIAFSAWYWGVGPSIVAALTGVAGVWFFFFRPLNSLGLRDARIEIPGMVGFLVFAGLIIALGEINRRSKVRLEREVLERQSTENILRDRQRELQDAQRLAAMGSWSWDPQTNAVIWSDGLYRIMGLDPQLLAPGFLDNTSLFTSESWQRLKAAVEHSLQTGEGYDLELEMVRPDGTTFISMTHAEAERGPGGRVARLFGTIQDMTETKRSQQALQESEQLLRIAQQASRSGSWASHYKTGRVLSSPELRELYGFPADFSDQDPDLFRSLILPEDLARVDSHHAEVLANHGDHFHIEFRIRRKDGAMRWIESTARVFYDVWQRPERIVGIATDITERKQIEERQRRLAAESLAATAKFRAVFDQTSVFAGIMEVDGTIIDANQVSLAACGYRAEEVLGKPFWQTPWWRLAPESREKIHAATQRASLGLPYRETLVYHWADASEHLVDFALHPIHDPEGRVIFLHPTGIDITDLKRNEDGLRRAHDEMERRVVERTGELAQSVVSLEAEMQVRQRTEQDLRMLSARVLRMQDEERRRIARDLHDSTGQTLAALRMSLASLEQRCAADPKASACLSEAQELANQALREIRTTSYLLHPPLLDEVGFASAARWYVEGFTSRSGIRADLQLAEVPPMKKEFELALFRILQESLSNVHRHSESGAVEIQLSADAENTVLSIRDFGKGMPPEKLANFQKTGAGVGVGLGGMKQRVRELGGQLRVESNRNGTCIVAVLPLSDPGSAAHDSDHDAPHISAA